MVKAITEKDPVVYIAGYETKANSKSVAILANHKFFQTKKRIQRLFMFM